MGTNKQKKNDIWWREQSNELVFVTKDDNNEQRRRGIYFCGNMRAYRFGDAMTHTHAHKIHTYFYFFGNKHLMNGVFQTNTQISLCSRDFDSSLLLLCGYFIVCRTHNTHATYFSLFSPCVACSD